MTSIERILQFIDFKGISKYEFLKKTGLSNGFLDKNRAIGTDKCEKILGIYPEISPEWLLTGKGDMVRKAESALKIESFNNSRVIGSNVNSPGSYTNESSAELIEIIKKQQEQMDSLILIIKGLSQ
jgi:hypothetical protein